MPSLYRVESDDPKYDAQRNLVGRTHYVDDDTLRGFRSRIQATRILDGGLIFALCESLSLDPDHRRRGFRWVAFDVFGSIISRPSVRCVTTRKKSNA